MSSDPMSQEGIAEGMKARAEGRTKPLKEVMEHLGLNDRKPLTAKEIAEAKALCEKRNDRPDLWHHTFVIDAILAARRHAGADRQPEMVERKAP